MDILVIAAHPDDEVLGMGGTIKKLVKKKNKIHLCIISEGTSAQYENKKMIKIRRESCLKSGKILGVSNFTFLDFPDMKLDTIPHLELNKEIEKTIKKVKPKIVFTTPYNDLNIDHQAVFNSTLVAARPDSLVKQIFCYELPGIIKKPFSPNTYQNIEKEFNEKIRAFKQYKTEIQKFPLPRSIESITSLANQRGTESGFKKAEAFEIIRNYIE